MQTGPFVTSVSWPQSARTYYQEKYKWTGPGRRRPMPYRIAESLSVGAWNVLNAEGMNSISAVRASELKTRCYDKFWAKAFDKASLGITLLESRKSYQMIASRARQLASAFQAFKRLDFRRVNRVLGVETSYKPVVRRYKDGTVNFASTWLEYTFGFVPLYQDIWSACNVLQQDFAAFKHKATVRDVVYFNHPWDGGSAYGGTGRLVYYYGANLRINNPNLLLANQLGLANPAYVLWDKVAFSFVVDWVLPVGKFLRSLSNNFGLTIEHAYHGWACVVEGFSRHTSHGSTFEKVRAKGGQRVLGALPAPGFFDRLRLPKVDPWLAITSLSLLTQQFNSVRK